MTATQTICVSSKSIKCPLCFRRICKITEEGGGPVIFFYHKKAVILTKKAAIKCLGCERSYIVTAETGIVKEVDIGDK